MHAQAFSADVRRGAPRIAVEAFCSEVLERGDRHAVVLDLSHTGVRLARPFTGGRTTRDIQLEFELPGLDEIIWARGEVCYERVRPAIAGMGVQLGSLVRQSGVRLVAAAATDLRKLRDYVMDRGRRAPLVTGPAGLVGPLAPRGWSSLAALLG